MLDGLCAPWLSTCFDRDEPRAAQKSLLLFALHYVPGRFGDVLESEIRFVAPSGFLHGLDGPHDVLERLIQTVALFLSLHARFIAAFLLLLRLHPLFPPFPFSSARYFISVCAARVDASARGPLKIATSRSKQSLKL